MLGPGTVGVEQVFLERAAAAHTRAWAVRLESNPTPVDEALTVRYAVLDTPTAPGGSTVIDVRGIHARYPALSVAAPAYQAANVATAVAVAEAALGRALDAERRPATHVPGRFELCARPRVVDARTTPAPL